MAYSAILWVLFMTLYGVNIASSALESDARLAGRKKKRGRATNQCSTSHRHRKSWSEITQTERDLYIRGFQKLADQGITQQFTVAHYNSAEHSNAKFFPWHRHFIYEFESAIRSLGGEFSCFVLPFWDWTQEPTPIDAQYNGETLFIMNSGLGGDSNGACVSNADWTHYHPSYQICLKRDLDYSVEISDCSFSSPQHIMDIIDSTDDYNIFRTTLEGRPHALPHICIGGDRMGHMATFHSPDDPIFYLHHSMIDYFYSLWQDCNNYDGAVYTTNSKLYNGIISQMLTFSPLPSTHNTRVSNTFDIANDYDVSYEKSQFWSNAEVDSDNNCGVSSDPTNPDWFYTENDGLITDDIRNKNNNRKSNKFAKQIWRELNTANPDDDRKFIVSKWAEMVCEYEELERGTMCTKPLNDYDDCSTMDIDPITNDITISMQELLDRDGITKCMKETVKKYYKWMEKVHQLKYLCAGCYDPFCNKDFLKDKCYDDSINYDDDQYENEKLMFLINNISKYGNNNITYLWYIAIFIVAILLLFMIKKCFCDNNDDNKNKELFRLNQEESIYGTV